MSDIDDNDDHDNYWSKRQLKQQAALWWFNAVVQCEAEGKQLKRDRKMSGAEHIIRHLNGHPMVCRDIYRLGPANFRLLCDELRARGFECKGDLIIEEHVGMFLQMVRQGDTMRILAEDFQHSEETVWRSLRKEMRCVKRMLPEYVKMPGVDAQIHPKLCNETQFNPFKDALGAIDGTHISAYPNSEKKFKERWRNRKGNMTQNVMAAVDFDGRFVAVVAGWEGSAHDNYILRDSLEKGFAVPEGRYYLVDGGYANTHQFLSPYRGQTYRLAQFQQRRQENRYESAEELFNYRHAQLRNIVEKVFGILKGRFKILKEMHKYKYDFQTDIVLACCVLHNFIMRHRYLEEDSQADSDYIDSDVEHDSNTDSSSTSGGAPMAEVCRGTDAQRGGELREKIRDRLWNAR